MVITHLFSSFTGEVDRLAHAADPVNHTVRPSGYPGPVVLDHSLRVNVSCATSVLGLIATVPQANAGGVISHWFCIV